MTCLRSLCGAGGLTQGVPLPGQACAVGMTTVLAMPRAPAAGL